MEGVVDVLLRIFQTIPHALSSAERTFSAKRRLKSWNRARSGATHLNNSFLVLEFPDIDCSVKSLLLFGKEF